jgi:hypothetical protein
MPHRLRTVGLLDVDVPTENLWRGADLGGTGPVAVDLPPADLADLEVAAVDLASRGVDPVETSAADLPLGTLAPLVDDLRHEVLHGRASPCCGAFPSTGAAWRRSPSCSGASASGWDGPSPRA